MTVDVNKDDKECKHDKVASMLSVANAVVGASDLAIPGMDGSGKAVTNDVVGASELAISDIDGDG